MSKQALISLFERDLGKLKAEILSYQNENCMWKVNDGINNSAGNLCLHICGNLQHFVGTGIGDTGYIRDREAEFSLKDVPVSELTGSIEKTSAVVTSVIANLNEEDLYKDIPENLFRSNMTIVEFLIHLLGHLNYHLGQINYHRRLSC